MSSAYQLTYLCKVSLVCCCIDKRLGQWSGWDKRRVNNLIPISLLALPGKMLERIVHMPLSEFLENNGLLTNAESGYGKGRSTLSSIYELTDKILSNRNVAINTLGTFFDSRKAFETVNHNILNYLGIKGKILDGGKLSR